MPKREQKILACVDRSQYADHVTDYAAWAAKRIGQNLELLHVIDRHPEIARDADHSGAIGIDAQEQLLNTLSQSDEARSRKRREQGRIFLNRLRERAMDAGVAHTDTRQRLGELQATLLEQQAEVSLYVLGRRGRSAEATQRDLGRNVERVVRALRQPILTVTDQFQVPRNALLAFDGGRVTRRGVEMVARSRLFQGMPVHLLMSGKPGRETDKQLEWAQNRLQKAGFEAPALRVPGDAERVIAGEVINRDIDILIMGAYSHSWPRSLLFGSKTSDVLRSARVPTLLLR